MSKFLKVIVNIIMIAAILSAVLILVPPLAGVNTTIIDSDKIDTNLPTGSITYSKEVYVTNIEAGNKILMQTDTSTYEYIVKEANASSGDFVVQDAMDQSKAEQNIQILNSTPRVVITIPFIGYIVYAMHSVEGLVVLALAVLFVIVLFVLSELWKKETEEDFAENFYEVTDDDDDFFDAKEAKAAKKEAKKEAKEAKKKRKQAEKYEESEESEPERIETPEKAAAEINEVKSEEYESVPVGGFEFEAGKEEPENLEIPAEDDEDDFTSFDEFQKQLETELSEAASEGTAEADENSEISEEFGFIADSPADMNDDPDEASAGKNDMNAGDFDDAEYESADMNTEAVETYDAYDTYEETAESDAKEPEYEEVLEEAEETFNMPEFIADPVFEDEGEYEDSFMAGAISDEREKARTAQESLMSSEAMEPESFVPVGRPSYEEIIKEAEKEGSQVDVREDQVTGISIVDYSDFL